MPLRMKRHSEAARRQASGGAKGPWEAEQQRAARLQLRSGGREEPPDQSGAEPGPQLSSVSVSVLCAPRGWGLDELLSPTDELSAIGHGCVGNGINDDAVSESTVGVGMTTPMAAL